MKELAQLIIKAVATFDPVITASGCGCAIPHGYDLTKTRQIYAEIAAEFGLNLDGMSGVVAGSCSGAPLERLVQAYGQRHSVRVGNVWVYGGAILLHHFTADHYDDHPLYAALRELTTQEVCDSLVMEMRQSALQKT